LLSLLLTQVDKLLLSTLLPLAEYGVYVLAAAVAAVPVSLTAAPITQAWFPRMSQLHASGNEAALAQTFHQGAQLASMTLGTAAIFLIFFSEPLLRIWTGDADLARQAAPLLSLLAFGNLLNGLMWLPYHAQLAHGWTSLTIHINTCAVLVIVPAILIVTPIYGAIGAASIWVALNAFYVLVGAPLMFRRILRGEQRRWYLEDLLRPLLAAAAVAVLLRWLLPAPESTALQAATLVGAGLLVLSGAAMAAREARSIFLTKLFATKALVGRGSA
jgi:O-antigen/teichoic acid export membrane protein